MYINQAISCVLLQLVILVLQKKQIFSCRKDNSENFLSNLSKAFQENPDQEGDQAETKCLVLANHSLGPANLSPGMIRGRGITREAHQLVVGKVKGYNLERRPRYN